MPATIRKARALQIIEISVQKSGLGEPAIEGIPQGSSGASGVLIHLALGFHTEFAAEEAASMGHKKPTSRKSKLKRPKTVLRLLDLEHSKTTVLNSLGAVSSQDSYGHAIEEFITWYCSEPRLSFSRTVVLRYRIHLEQENLAPSTINVRLAAVRRLAYEASDNGLLSPELAAGIRRVRSVKRLGVRIGNWLTLEQSRTLLISPCSNSVRGKRDRAVLTSPC